MKMNHVFGSLLFMSSLAPVSAFATDAGSQYYFRCNSTSWQAVEESRLKPQGNGKIVSLTYSVNDAAVGSYGEDCALTETPEVNAWGAWQKDYDLNFSALNVKSLTAIGDGSDYRPFNFKVNYAGTGSYKVTLNLESKQLYLSNEQGGYVDGGHIGWGGQGHGQGHGPQGGYHPAPAPVPAPAPAGDSYWYLRCDSTSFEANEQSRFKPEYGDVQSLDFQVSNDYFVSNGDGCRLTQTNAFNSFGTWRSNYNLDGASLNEGNVAYFGAPADESYTFNVKFGRTGAHKAYLNAKSFQVWVR